MQRPDTTQRRDMQRPDTQRPDTQRPDTQRPDTQRLDMQRRCFALTATAAWIGLPAAFSRAAEQAVAVDLSSKVPAGLPDGFVAARTGKGAAAEWRSGPNVSAAPGAVLTQISTDQTDYRFPLAIYQAVSAVDVEAEIRFKAIAGRVDRAAGIAVRLLDANNYYVARANALEDNVNFYRVVKGARQEIKGASARVASDVWHTMGLRAAGDSFTISFNGKTLFTAVDRSFAGAGKIALWTKADSVTAFSMMSIKVLS